MWEDNKAVVEWLSDQLDEENLERSVICENIRCIRRDYVMQQIRRQERISNVYEFSTIETGRQGLEVAAVRVCLKWFYVNNAIEIPFEYHLLSLL